MFSGRRSAPKRQVIQYRSILQDPIHQRRWRHRPIRRRSGNVADLINPGDQPTWETTLIRSCSSRASRRTLDYFLTSDTITGFFKGVFQGKIVERSVFWGVQVSMDANRWLS